MFLKLSTIKVIILTETSKFLLSFSFKFKKSLTPIIQFDSCNGKRNIFITWPILKTKNNNLYLWEEIVSPEKVHKINKQRTTWQTSYTAEVVSERSRCLSIVRPVGEVLNSSEDWIRPTDAGERPLVNILFSFSGTPSSEMDKDQKSTNILIMQLKIFFYSRHHFYY